MQDPYVLLTEVDLETAISQAVERALEPVKKQLTVLTEALGRDPLASAETIAKERPSEEPTRDQPDKPAEQAWKPGDYRRDGLIVSAGTPLQLRDGIGKHPKVVATGVVSGYRLVMDGKPFKAPSGASKALGPDYSSNGLLFIDALIDGHWRSLHTLREEQRRARQIKIIPATLVAGLITDEVRP